MLWVNQRNLLTKTILLIIHNIGSGGQIGILEHETCSLSRALFNCSAPDIFNAVQWLLITCKIIYYLPIARPYYLIYYFRLSEKKDIWQNNINSGNIKVHSFHIFWEMEKNVHYACIYSVSSTKSNNNYYNFIYR